MNRIILTREQYQSILGHCQAAAPYEAVGLIGGHSLEEAMSVFPVVNSAAEKNSFFVDPYSQFTALKAIREAGMSPLALYHSHPEGMPELSSTDIFFARKHSLIQIVMALKPPDAKRELTKAYRVTSSGHVNEIPLILK